MSLSDCIILQALFDQWAQRSSGDWSRFLPEDQRHLFSHTPFANKPFDPGLFGFDQLFSSIHYSWFDRVLKPLEKTQAALFLPLLGEDRALELGRMWGVKKEKHAASGFLEAFLQTALSELILEDKTSVLPIAYLPLSPLTELFELSKKQLVLLIDYLSLHDLSSELKQSVDPKIINHILPMLREEERHLLHKLMQRKELLTPPRIGLERIYEDEAALRSLLHKRGIKRLSLALAKEHPDFVWHLAHILDAGRGQMLLKMQEEFVDERLVQIVQPQVLEILPSLGEHP